MTHIAIQAHLNGNVVGWLERVSDAQYGGRPELIHHLLGKTLLAQLLQSGLLLLLPWNQDLINKHSGHGTGSL